MNNDQNTMNAFNVPNPPQNRLPEPALLILYDGVCGLCDRTVQFLLAVDGTATFKFAPLQSEIAAQVYQRHFRKKPLEFESIIFVKDYRTSREIILEKSDAAIEILIILGGYWRLLGIAGKFVPRMIRDRVYDWIAKNRYRWFGKFDQCRLPSPETRDRFLN